MGDSVRRVLRRSLLILLPLAAVATGCSTFSDSDAVARVNDVELSSDEFDARLVELGATDDLVVPLEPVRAEITRWIQSQLIPDDEIAAIYGAGPDEAGIICVNAIVVEDGDVAADAIADLEAGTPYIEVFAANNLDESLTPNNGSIPCLTSQDLVDSADTPFIAEIATMSADSPVTAAPIIGTDGSEVAWVVLSFRPFDELEVTDADRVAAGIDLAERATDADIFVDSRYGVFDPIVGEVVGLG